MARAFHKSSHPSGPGSTEATLSVFPLMVYAALGTLFLIFSLRATDLPSGSPMAQHRIHKQQLGALHVPSPQTDPLSLWFPLQKRTVMTAKLDKLRYCKTRQKASYPDCTWQPNRKKSPKSRQKSQRHAPTGTNPTKKDLVRDR